MKLFIFLIILALVFICVSMFVNMTELSIIGVYLFGIAMIIFIIKMLKLEKESEEKAKMKKEEERKKEKERIEKVKEAHINWLYQNYNISKIIGFYDDSLETLDIKRNWIVAIDEKNKFLIFGKKVITFEKIIKAELKISTSHHTKTDTNKNKAIGRAFLGGLIAGEAGAIIGAATATETANSETITNHHVDGVIIYLSDIIEPTYEYNSPIEKCNRDVYSVLLAIIDQNKKQPF